MSRGKEALHTLSRINVNRYGHIEPCRAIIDISSTNSRRILVHLWVYEEVR